MMNITFYENLHLLAPGKLYELCSMYFNNKRKIVINGEPVVVAMFIDFVYQYSYVVGSKVKVFRFLSGNKNDNENRNIGILKLYESDLVHMAGSKYFIGFRTVDY
jgi:hypothetical protein